MASGGVDVEVDADHALEQRQGGVETAGVRGADDRIAPHRHEALDLPLSRCIDLLGETSRRHFTDDFGGVADTCVGGPHGERT